MAPSVLTVLLIDDHQDSREVFRTLLVHAGYRVLEAATGADGREVLSRHRVDLILLDRHLPDMDGIDLVAELDLERICVVTLSANARPEAEIEAMEAGCRASLVKPIEPREVERTVRELIGSPGSRP